MGVTVREKAKGSREYREYWVFVVHQGKRRSKLVGDKKAANAVVSELRERLKKGEFRLRGQAPTFAELAEQWLQRYPLLNEISQTTIENYASFTRQHLLPYFGPKPVDTITMETVEDFIVAKRQAGSSARFWARPLGTASLRSGLVVLRLILEAAVKAGHLPRNPARGVAKFQRNDEEHVDPFTSAELASTLAAAPAEGPTFAAMVRLWAQSGMRAGEVATLRWEDLDTIRGTAVVRRTLSRGRIGPTKTRRVREVSFLHPVAEETPKWRPGVTLASRVVLNELRRLPVQAISGRAGLRPRRRPSLGPDVGASVVAASAPRRRSALPRPGDASAHTVLDAALP